MSLFLRKKAKVSNKQGELLLNPVWSRIIFQKQAPEQAWKQDQKQIPEQAWK